MSNKDYEIIDVENIEHIISTDNIEDGDWFYHRPSKTIRQFINGTQSMGSMYLDYVDSGVKGYDTELLLTNTFKIVASDLAYIDLPSVNKFRYGNNILYNIKDIPIVKSLLVCIAIFVFCYGTKVITTSGGEIVSPYDSWWRLPTLLSFYTMLVGIIITVTNKLYNNG